MTCRTCSAPTSLKYNGFPLCQTHYCQCVRNKIHSKLKGISPVQPIVLFGGSHTNIKFCAEIVVDYVQKFVVDVQRTVFVASDIDTNVPNTTFVKLDSCNYFEQLTSLIRYCSDHKVATIVDCSDADVLTTRILTAVTRGSTALAVRCAKPVITINNAIAADTANAKHAFKFPLQTNTTVIRLLVDTSQHDICLITGQQYEQGDEIMAEILLQHTAITKMGLVQVVEEEICERCGADCRGACAFVV